MRQGKIVRVYFTDRSQAVYQEHRKHCGKPFRLLDSWDFIQAVCEAMENKNCIGRWPPPPQDYPKILVQLAIAIGGNAKGWSKEVNMVSWNDHEPKYDIRDWSEGHEKLGKGVTLTGEEVKKLRDILNPKMKK